MDSLSSHHAPDGTIEKDVPDAKDGFRILVSANKFPRSLKEPTWLRSDSGGNCYRLDDPPMEGWICLAMFRYDQAALKHIDVKDDPLKRESVNIIWSAAVRRPTHPGGIPGRPEVVATKSMIKITPICTGAARMKRAQQTGREGRSAFARKVDIFRDKEWVRPLPILAFLIEHPEGRFLVDTGDTAENSTPGYLPWWNPFFTKMVEIKVAPMEEIGPRLHSLGIDPARDITAVILTHYHHDHTGGLHHFPHNRIIGPRDGWKISSGLQGKMMGCLPQRWPIWFRPEQVEMDGPAVGPFPASHPITRDGRILMVPTPGHFFGHTSVIVRDDDVTYFLAGDATYTEANLRADLVDGVTYNPALSLATLRAIKEFAAHEPTILLPSHDPEGFDRLANRVTL